MRTGLPKDPLAGPQLESKRKNQGFGTHVRLLRTLTEIDVNYTPGAV
jgi:hypothetical protein